MPGPSTASDFDAEAIMSLGRARARTTEGAVSVMDVRPPSFTVFELEEQEAELLEVARKAGAATEGIVRKVESAFSAVRAELNERAGGQASSRVALLAHHAQRAELALELQTCSASLAHGNFVKVGLDKGQLERALRNLTGIAAFATDLLNKAYEAAREEGAARAATPAEQLFARIGASSSSAPVSPPGWDRFEASPEQNPASPNPSSETTSAPKDSE